MFVDNWNLYKAQLIWWWRHGQEDNPRKSPVGQYWTIITFGFGLHNYTLKGIRFVRKK